MHAYTDYISINYLHDLPEDKAPIQTKTLSILALRQDTIALKQLLFYHCILFLSSNYFVLDTRGKCSYLFSLLLHYLYV